MQDGASFSGVLSSLPCGNHRKSFEEVQAKQVGQDELTVWAVRAGQVLRTVLLVQLQDAAFQAEQLERVFWAFPCHEDLQAKQAGKVEALLFVDMFQFSVTTMGAEEAEEVDPAHLRP